MKELKIKPTNMKNSFNIINYNTEKLCGVPIYDDGYSIKNIISLGNKIGYIKSYDNKNDMYNIILYDQKNIDLYNLSLSLAITVTNGEIDPKNIDLNADNITVVSAVIVNDFPKNNIICLCGSTKFKKDFEDIYKKFSLKGYIVLMPCFLSKKDKENLLFSDKLLLHSIFRKKIELADSIYIINKDNYIGDDTMSDIEYAVSLSKPIKYMVN